MTQMVLCSSEVTQLAESTNGSRDLAEFVTMHQQFLKVTQLPKLIGKNREMKRAKVKFDDMTILIISNTLTFVEIPCCETDVRGKGCKALLIIIVHTLPYS